MAIITGNVSTVRLAHFSLLVGHVVTLQCAYWTIQRYLKSDAFILKTVIASPEKPMQNRYLALLEILRM